MMHKSLHLRDEIGRLYISRQEEAWKTASMHQYVNPETTYKRAKKD